MKRNSNPNDFDVSNKFDREAAESVARKMIAKGDAKRIEAAETLFNDDEEFQNAVFSKVLPALVSIKACDRVMGSGFFQHSEWLVSNAHIFPNSAFLAKAELIDWQGNILSADVQKSYHRPSENNKAPDIVIANITRSTNENSCFPTELSWDNGLEKRILFYIELKPNTKAGYVIKRLQALSETDALPMIYKCLDGSEPQPGSSGSPIIEARVMYGHEAQWQFKIVSVLYARCSAHWHNNNNSDISIDFLNNTKLVCAIPVKEDFSKIFKMRQNKKMSIRYEMMADAHKRLGDDQAAMANTTKSKQFELLVQNGFQEFETGVTNLNIALPDGLEKLFYNIPVPVSSSLLLFNVLKGIMGKKFANSYCNNRFKKDFRPSEQDLEEDLKDFIKQIEKIKSLQLHTRNENNKFHSQKGFFRIDISGGKNADWKIDIQDNTDAKGSPKKIKTNKGKKGKRKKETLQPMSSVFAIVKISRQKRHISGSELAKLFRNYPLINALYTKGEEAQEKQKKVLEITKIFSELIKITKVPIDVYMQGNEGKNYLVVQLNLENQLNKVLIKTLYNLLSDSVDNQEEELWIQEDAFERYIEQDANEISSEFWDLYSRFQEDEGFYQAVITDSDSDASSDGRYNALPLPPPPSERSEYSEYEEDLSVSAKSLTDSEKEQESNPQEALERQQKKRLERIPHSQYGKSGLFSSNPNPKTFTKVDRLKGNYPLRSYP